MNKLILSLALLSQIGTAHAGDDVYVTYVNKLPVPLRILFDTQRTDCFYQTDIPSDITVNPGQSAGPFHGETNQAFFGHCFRKPGDFTLSIMQDNPNMATQCQLFQHLQEDFFDMYSCIGNLSFSRTFRATVANSLSKSQKEDALTITFEDWTNRVSSSVLKGPHHLKEIEHYNTSKINPMMRDHQIMNLKPMIEKR